MKLLMTYSSKTGNTEKIALAIKKEAEAWQNRGGRTLHFCKIGDAPDLKDFDAVILGFWIDRGRPELKSLDYIKTIFGKTVAFFCTLGASPDSPHAEKCMEGIRELLQSQGNTLAGEFICQGKIDERLIEAFKSFPETHPQFYNEENKRRYAEAASHPDEEDLRRARETFRNIFEKLKAQE